MIDNRGKIRCDREIGGPPKWHSCNKPATAVVEGFQGMTLHYCADHLEPALKEGRKFVRAIPAQEELPIGRLDAGTAVKITRACS